MSTSIIVKVVKDGDAMPFVYFPKNKNAFVTFPGHRMLQDQNIQSMDDFIHFIHATMHAEIQQDEWNYIYAQIASGEEMFTIDEDLKVVRPEV